MFKQKSHTRECGVASLTKVGVDMRLLDRTERTSNWWPRRLVALIALHSIVAWCGPLAIGDGHIAGGARSYNKKRKVGKPHLG